jgi:HEAT repeat protein
MRHLTPLVLLSALLAGCSKKNPPGAADPGAPGADAPADATAAERAKLLAALKGTNQKARQEAVNELSAWVESDPETVRALVDLLRDKGTAGAGKTSPTQVNSTREAAARALLLAGPRGEAVLRDKGLAVLREGLSDPSPAVREHTAYTLGRLGPLAKPLSPEVMKLCTDPKAEVRQAAFDALRKIGVTDAAGFIALLNDKNPDVAQLAAEQVREMNPPDAAIAPLIAALASDDNQVRLAAATAMGRAGPKAAPAAEAIAEAVRKTFPRPYTPGESYDSHADDMYWDALRRIGEPAAIPLGGLLSYRHPMVRRNAARSLAEMGPRAKAAADQLKVALKDEYGLIAIEAACALCKIGEGQQEAADLVRRAMDAPNEVAYEAIVAIPRMGEAGKPLVPVALGKLTSDNRSARAGAVELIGKLDKAEAAKVVPELSKLATDPEPGVRYHVAETLKKLGPVGAPAAEAIGAALAADKNEDARKRFAVALVAMKSGARGAVPACLPALSDKTLPSRLRGQLIVTLAVAAPDSKELATALIAAAGDTDQTVRLAAVEALGHLDSIADEALARLVAAAKTDGRHAARAAALRGLAAAGPRAKATRGEIEPIAAGSQEDLALWGKVALAAIDGNVAGAAPAVRSGLTDPRPAVRAAAVEALLLVGPAASDVPALVKLLKETGANTKEAAARCVARVGPAAKDAVPPLVHLLGDGDADVRLAAVEALGEIGPAANEAVGKLKDLRDESPLGEAAKKSLEKIGWREP